MWSLVIPIDCNSFYFYIKPQLDTSSIGDATIVIHSISTSNHNSTNVGDDMIEL